MHREHRSIRELAYQLWVARGCPDGSAEQDWLEAERRLSAAGSRPPVASSQAASSQAASSQAASSQAASSQAASSKAAASSKGVDDALQDTYPASDPPASHLPDEPPANADAKWEAAAAADDSKRRASSMRRAPDSTPRPRASGRRDKATATGSAQPGATEPGSRPPETRRPSGQ
jgi:Protein of unknown function (DUF2934)